MPEQLVAETLAKAEMLAVEIAGGELIEI